MSSLNRTKSENFGNLRRFVIAAIAVCAVYFQVNMAVSQESRRNLQVGETAQVVNFVMGDNMDTLRQLSVNDPVYARERISAELDSYGEIQLNDNSRIVVGPGAEISLDDFVVAENGIKSGTLNILKGAFRFVSGNSPRGTFKVTTPLSTIGIRGTLFDVYVRENGQTDVILFSGRLRVCTLANRCRVVYRGCDIIRVTSRRNIGFKKFLRSGNKSRENADYNLIKNQKRFQKGWRAPVGECQQRATKVEIEKYGAGGDSREPSNYNRNGEY